MKIFVINLDRSTDRLNHMTVQLERLGYPWERFSALGPAQVEEMSRTLELPLLRGTCTAGEKGAALSHYSIWEKVVKEGIDHALVLEDDVHFCRDARHLLDSINERFSRGFRYDVIKMETSLAGIFIDRKGLDLSTRTGLHRLRSNHTGAGAYIISNAGCRKMIERFAMNDRAVDLVMFNGDLEETYVYQLHPAACIQDVWLKSGKKGMTSEIGEERSDWKPGSVWLQRAKSPFRGAYDFVQSLRVWNKGLVKIRSSYMDGI
ncbi:glycosyltransferase family 25 protein [Paraburkholderia sabiae]|jgi:glycosyl transferase family 25|uniref:Glycosyltransferase family 25 protein n=2 Tax=Paraburkholderia sabiae TaxID=273251 RepID=A0ABU9QNS9_9BURK|nr:glycosyltransferase family 25 protein [Paraburkholderia sabiae]WJZ72962.1 glycosyltransferase family 25 protein [Paraburkholderia sabiae]CAD6562320.1 Lipooligosaccharide biosynthesis protein lex-1 [Paraburkholderia sabiae]CAG9193222.1 Glycosyl transferase [Paraburkholderia sabiae]